MSMFNTKSVSIILGASLCGVSGYFMYQYLNPATAQKDEANTVTTTIIKIPTHLVGYIIGRGGSKIRSIQEASETTIKIVTSDDPEREDCICAITGTIQCVAQAECEIKDILHNQTEESCLSVWVPKQTVAKIFGVHMDRESDISAISGARLEVTEWDYETNRRKITIRGTKKQLYITKTCIDEIVCNYEKITQALARRQPRGPIKNENGEVVNTECPDAEKLTMIPGQSDSPFEVYVSAMIDPSRFWVQIVGPKAKELDLLVEEMTEYYRNPENLEWHKFDVVLEGDLVAATFQYDNKWYRAEVLKLNDNARAELYYVDYGDTDMVNVKDLYTLRTDFLRLHFQAIECFLARVEPTGDGWAEEAIDKFEEWTHVAQWKKLSAKVNEYCVKEKTRAKREGSPVPGVDLFDVVNDKDIDIANELVRQGYAVYKKELTKSSSRSTSMSNISIVSNNSMESSFTFTSEKECDLME